MTGCVRIKPMGISRCWKNRKFWTNLTYAWRTDVFFSVSPYSPSPFLHSLQTFRSNIDCRSRSQKRRLFCSLVECRLSIGWVSVVDWGYPTNTRPTLNWHDITAQCWPIFGQYLADVLTECSCTNSKLDHGKLHYTRNSPRLCNMHKENRKQKQIAMTHLHYWRGIFLFLPWLKIKGFYYLWTVQYDIW